jgi:hypothetical protein
MATPRPRRSKKWPTNFKKFSILEIFSKVEVQKLNICACLSRLIKLDEKKITLDTYFGGIFYQDKK